MKPRALIVVLLVLALAAWLLAHNASDDTARRLSVRELAATRYVTSEEWLPFYDVHRPRGTGWVLLPAEGWIIPSSKTSFRSDAGRDEVVTPDVCGECHEDNYGGWQETAHALTSRPASQASVDGSFQPGENRLETRTPNLFFQMTAEDDGLYQTVSVRFGQKTYKHTERFDIVTGSGHHGQTYLYWHGDRLYQLPVSYFGALSSWSNSPGQYVDGTADFARPIGERCLDCHATWFAKAPEEYNRYDTTNYVLGVTCVRCHGPGRKHVEYHRANPEATEARFIVHPTTLARERTNVICAQCHSGIGRLLQPAFSYRPGDPIEEYVELESEERSGANDDPHAANQLARLRRSKCYKMDESLTCATCHNPHRFERGDRLLFAKRCMECHKAETCSMAKYVWPQIREHCVSCHMPLKDDELTPIQMAGGGRVLPKLRDHYIKGWPEATRQVLEALGK